MERLGSVLMLIVLFSCSRSEAPVKLFPLQEEAMAVAASKCQSGDLLWLRDILIRSENDSKSQGSLYAISVQTGTVFLYQAWLSNCFGCEVYNCNGENPAFSEAERSEIMAGIREENVIYSSTF